MHRRAGLLVVGGARRLRERQRVPAGALRRPHLRAGAGEQRVHLSRRRHGRLRDRRAARHGRDVHRSRERGRGADHRDRPRERPDLSPGVRDPAHRAARGGACRRRRLRQRAGDGVAPKRGPRRVRGFARLHPPVPELGVALMAETSQTLVVAGREVKITNVEKVFFPKPGLTKGDLVRYYVDVAHAVLHHVARRPMQMKRHPNGVDGDFFYQKRVPNPHPDWLETVHISYPSGNEADFPVVTDAAGLAWIANLGCIELHTWHSRVSDINRPDYLLIDLDPSEGNPWSHVREIAVAAKQVMDDLGVPSYPKTSGATGMHILIPIRPELEFPLVREIARAIAKAIVKVVPTIATTQWKVAGRPGVFVDYGQNAFDRTIASAYSIRPVEDARASAPLRWDEVAAVEPGDFTMTTMRRRLDAVGDLTAGMWDRAVSLDPLFDMLKVKRVMPKRSSRPGPPRDWRAEYDARRAGGSGWNRGTQRGPSHR